MLRISFKSWWGGWQEWGIIIPLFLALEIAVGSIEQARWITPHPSLTLVLVLAVLTGWLLGKSRLPTIVIHPLAVVLGAAVTLWQASNLLPSVATTSRVYQLLLALQSWWQTTSAAEPSQGTIHFAVFLIFVTWITGYISTWFILRRQNAWVAVSLGAIIILVNLGNLPQQHYTFFFLYLFLALVLIGMTNLALYNHWFKKGGISYPNRGLFYFMAPLLCFSILAVATAWLTPEVRVERLETWVSTETLWRKDIERHFNNLLASIPAKQPFLRSDEQGALLFGDSSFDQGDWLQGVVISEGPLYLRTRMHDIYTASGWTSSHATEQMLRQRTLQTEADGIAKRRELTYTVITKLRTDALLITGEFISSDIATSVQTLTPLSFDIDLLRPDDDRSLPPDVASLADSFRDMQVENKKIRLNELWQLLPEDLTLTNAGTTYYSSDEADYAPEPVLDSAQLSTIDITRLQPASSNIVAVTSFHPLRPDRRYTVTASISSATPEDLSEAGDDYPHWVQDYYLQLPAAFPERLRQLSESVTREAKTPYAKALAIERYLSQFEYRIEVEAPPQGVDGVDYFLFTQKSGNCVQFSSAMAVMLRAIGVPSRVSRGYAPGEWDAATGSSILTSKERHAWPEVYFSGYGWVGFEATPRAGGEQEAIPVAGGRLESLGLRPALEDEEELDNWLALLRWLRGLEQPERREWLESVGWRQEELDEWLEWLERQEQLQSDIVTKGSNVSDAVATSRNQSGIILFFPVIVTILLVYILWSAFSHRRQRLVRSDYASEVYRKMYFLASLLRLEPKPQQTPLEYYARLASVFPRQVEALECIVQTYVERQFSRRKELDHWQRGMLRKSWKRIYPAFLKRLFHLRY
ncbi:MAG: hypothetical protein HYU85_06945 [Chloroflexi bacterium]|nr:hypothetical protein [Chloroflexota bacterium]